MLLWLSLLLCSGACWAEQMYGTCTGQYFSSSVNNNYDISGIQVSFGSIGIMKGIRLKLGDVWGPWYGVNGGTTQEIVLWPNEHIVAVYGSRKAFIRSLAFYTDQHRYLPFGTKSGSSFMAYADSSGKVLTGIFGQKRALGICGISFTWDYPLVTPNTDDDQNTGDDQKTGNEQNTNNNPNTNNDQNTNKEEDSSTPEAPQTTTNTTQSTVTTKTGK